ncbi:MAG: ATP-binding protein [Lachnospiraceae bacterium]|jgi:predicted AAA+ superfamily ATPase|nr:ATP-binding protein [Lachnospiraceae bacterium]
MDDIKRDLEEQIPVLSEKYPCVLVIGPRQAGKTTLLKRLMGENRSYVNLEDYEERRMAKTDPVLFLQMHALPIYIDEIQYAPELLVYLKIAVDNGAGPGTFWLASSQNFPELTALCESSAKGVAVCRLSFLSQHEMYGRGKQTPFSVHLNGLVQRKQNHKAADLGEMYERIWRGSMPKQSNGGSEDWAAFYNSYLQSYIERDAGELVSLSDKMQFRDFIRAAACRTGQMLNLHQIAQEVGISDDTARRWLVVLERTHLIFCLYPYQDEKLRRAIKAPKLYFADTGLVAYLTRYGSPEILMNGALSGSILENYAVGEIVKSYALSRDCRFWYYRDKEGKEIDLILEREGWLCPLEVKRSANPEQKCTRVFSILDKASLPRERGAVLCLRGELAAFNSNDLMVPVWMI